MQSAHDNDGEGALRVGADGMRERGRQQAERCDQHGHHHRAQAQHGTFDGGFDDVLSTGFFRPSCAARATG